MSQGYTVLVLAQKKLLFRRPCSTAGELVRCAGRRWNAAPSWALSKQQSKEPEMNQDPHALVRGFESGERSWMMCGTSSSALTAWFCGRVLSPSLHLWQELGQHHLHRARAVLSLERVPQASCASCVLTFLSGSCCTGFQRRSATWNGIFALGKLPRSAKLPSGAKGRPMIGRMFVLMCSYVDGSKSKAALPSSRYDLHSQTLTRWPSCSFCRRWRSPSLQRCSYT